MKSLQISLVIYQITRDICCVIERLDGICFIDRFRFLCFNIGKLI